MSESVHTIPVPVGMSPEHAWERISRHEWFTADDYGGEWPVDDSPAFIRWVTVIVEDNKLKECIA